MSMSVGPAAGEGDPMVEMNTTPLIDVLLVLIVMLIITLPVQTHAVKIDNPQGDPPAQETEPEVVKLDIDFDGTIYWNGTAVPDKRTLDYYLRDIGKIPVESQAQLHIKPHRLALYDHVATVLAAAQRFGVIKIGFVGQEQYM